jgi:hypothetical protein
MYNTTLATPASPTPTPTPTPAPINPASIKEQRAALVKNNSVNIANNTPTANRQLTFLAI